MAVRVLKRFWKSRRSIFFTGIAILLVGLLLYSITASFEFEKRKVNLATRTRMLTMNSFIKDVNKDMERAAYIASVRSIISMGDYVANNAEYLDSFNDAFQGYFLNGSYHGNVSALMTNSTFPYWVGKIQEQGESFGLVMAINTTAIETYQDSPWEVKVKIAYRIDLEDQKGIASWHNNYSLITAVSIEGMDEPFSLINTAGKGVYQITMKNVSSFVNKSNNDTANLLYFIDQKQFVATNLSPNFIMRMQGNITNSSYGIETILDLEEIKLEIPVDETLSWVDYLYWNGSGWGATYSNFTNIPFNLTLDEQHLEIYEADGLWK